MYVTHGWMATRMPAGHDLGTETAMAHLRIGILGMGNAGSHHAGYLLRDEVAEVTLAAVCECSPDPARQAAVRAQVGAGVQVFDDYQRMLASGAVDAVLVAVPHPGHAAAVIAAAAAGVHALVEKPVAVHVGQARAMAAAAAAAGVAYGAMFSMRAFRSYRTIRDLVAGGELGELRRVSWTATRWFRPQSYYDSAGWRGTWAGEGGGVLINQAPHTLDLLQWIAGMPARLSARCGFGRHHRIEVEDEATALLEYPSGATGVFTTSTGEAPGTDRLELAGDRGKLVYEDRQLVFWRTRRGVRAFSDDPATPGFAEPEHWRIPIPVEADEGYNKAAVGNFARAVLHGEPLLAPGVEAGNSLELSNAMLLSAWSGGAWIDLPVDAGAIERELAARCAAPPPAKAATGARLDLAHSFRHA